MSDKTPQAEPGVGHRKGASRRIRRKKEVPETAPSLQESEPDSGSVLWVLLGLLLLVGVWAGGTWLAHSFWEFSWLVSALLAPVALAVLYILLKISSLIFDW